MKLALNRYAPILSAADPATAFGNAVAPYYPGNPYGNNWQPLGQEGSVSDSIAGTFEVVRVKSLWLPKSENLQMMYKDRFVRP